MFKTQISNLYQFKAFLTISHWRILYIVCLLLILGCKPLQLFGWWGSICAYSPLNKGKCRSIDAIHLCISRTVWMIHFPTQIHPINGSSSPPLVCFTYSNLWLHHHTQWVYQNGEGSSDWCAASSKYKLKFQIPISTYNFHWLLVCITAYRLVNHPLVLITWYIK